MISTQSCRCMLITQMTHKQEKTTYCMCRDVDEAVLLNQLFQPMFICPRIMSWNLLISIENVLPPIIKLIKSLQICHEITTAHRFWKPFFFITVFKCI